jgi:PAS domain S-box-containing protein
MERCTDDVSRKRTDGFTPSVFRALLDRASDAIQVTDPKTRRFLYANDASLQMHGYSREELMSMSVQDLDPYVSQAEVKKINETLRTDRSVMFEGFHRRKDGSRFAVEVQISMVRVDGRDWRLAVTRDITKRRTAETGLQLFRALLDRASDAIEVIDPVTLRYLDVNETACRVLGYSRDELLAMSVWDIDPGMEAVSMERARETLQAGQPLTHESLHRRKDGSLFPVEVVISQVELDKPYNIAVARDISERKQSEQVLRQTNRALKLLSRCNAVLVRAEKGGVSYGSMQVGGENRRLHDGLGWSGGRRCCENRTPHRAIRFRERLSEKHRYHMGQYETGARSNRHCDQDGKGGGQPGLPEQSEHVAVARSRHRAWISILHRASPLYRGACAGRVHHLFG